MEYQRPNPHVYRLARCIAWPFSVFFYRLKIRRNELKGAQGPFVVLANHGSKFDFVNLIRLTKRPLTIVMSNTFFSTLPLKRLLPALAVIPKQQFQTRATDLRRMKAVLDAGEALAIYPAGLMTEDGQSTPIPESTWKFLQWMDADVYCARSSGAYLTMPKWGKLRRGRASMDAYRLFTKEELSSLTEQEIRRRTLEALSFNDYEEQREPCAGFRDIRGLEGVLTRCPACGGEFTISAVSRDTLRCSACGFEERSGADARLTKTAGPGEEISSVSDWSSWIDEEERKLVSSPAFGEFRTPVSVSVLDYEKRKVRPAGTGTVTVRRDGFVLKGTLDGEEQDVFFPLTSFPTLPVTPGRYFELQSGPTVYRCFPDEPLHAMKVVRLCEALFLQQEPRKRGVR